jgi:Mrp family chromosome partitioning ATPase
MEGKTTVAVNIAIAAASFGRRVVLVDADLHRPTAHILLSEPLSPGLSTYLEGRTQARAMLARLEEEIRARPASERTGRLEPGDIRVLQKKFPHGIPEEEDMPASVPVAQERRLPPVDRDAVRQILRDTRIAGLAFVPAGPPPPNPHGLLEKPEFEALLRHLAKDADLLIVDGPPVLAGPDAAVIAKRAEMTLIVARAGRTRRPDLAAAKRGLLHAGARNMAVLLNGVRSETMVYADYDLERRAW